MKLALLALVPSLAFAQVAPSEQTDPLGGGPVTAGDDTALWSLADGGVVVLVTNSAMNQNAGVQAFSLEDGGHFITSTVDGPAVAVDVRYGLAFDGGLVDVVLGVKSEGTFLLYTPGSAGLLSHLTPSASMGSLVTPSAGALAWFQNDLFIFIGSFNGQLLQYRVDVAGGAVTFTQVAARQLGNRQIKAIDGDELHNRLLVSMAGTGLVGVPLDPNEDAGFKLIDKEDGGSFGASPSGIAVYPGPGDAGSVTVVDDTVSERVGVYVGDQLAITFKITASGSIGAVHAPLGIAALSNPSVAPFGSGIFAIVDPQNVTGPNAKLVPWAAIKAQSDSIPINAFDERALPHAPAAPDAGMCISSDAGHDGGLDGGDGGNGGCGAGGGGGGSGGAGGIHVGPGDGVPYEDHHCGCSNFGAFGGALWLLGLALRRKKS
jgi:myo-inositol-hexaphosphate 3-phosphohydrolase